MCCRADQIRLKFRNLTRRLQRYRSSGAVDLEKMMTVIFDQATPKVSPTDVEAFKGRVDRLDGGLLVCDGHDLLNATGVVLSQDFGVDGRLVESIPSVLRSSLDAGTFATLEIGKRLAQWEARTGLHVLS
jgi:hypothetical protein